MISRVGVLHADHLGGGVLRRFDVIEGVDDRDARDFFAASALTPSTRLRRLGAFWLPARIAILPLLADLLRQLGHHRLAQLHVVDAVEREPLGLGRVAVEGHDRHAARDRVVDGAGHLAGVRARDQDGVGALVDRLGDRAAPAPGRLPAAASTRRSRSATPCLAATAPSRPPPRPCAPTGTPGWSSSSRSARSSDRLAGRGVAPSAGCRPAARHAGQGRRATTSQHARRHPKLSVDRHNHRLRHAAASPFCEAARWNRALA